MGQTAESKHSTERDPMEAGELAAGFVERVLDNTLETTPFGGEFETQLPWLWKQI